MTKAEKALIEVALVATEWPQLTPVRRAVFAERFPIDKEKAIAVLVAHRRADREWAEVAQALERTGNMRPGDPDGLFEQIWLESDKQLETT